MTSVAGFEYSRLADDPDLAEVIELFVAELPQRLADMQAALDDGEWERLRTLAHQLKGAGGSHGFDALTPVAFALEQAAKEARPRAEIAAAFDQLNATCRQVRPGQPA